MRIIGQIKLALYRKFQLWRWFKAFWTNSFILPYGSRVHNQDCISIGNDVSIGKRTSLLVTKRWNGQTFEPQLEIGDRFCCGHDLFVACIDGITIEEDVLFSDRVFICDHNHGYEDTDQPIRIQDLKKRGKVIIKSGSFVGINAVILPGVTIGKNAVVWASSVVTQSVPDYAVVTGNPAQIVKWYDTDTKTWKYPVRA